MSYRPLQISKVGNKNKSRKYTKKMRNRKIRRVSQFEIPDIKYMGWDD
jgi:hypothetical protein